MKDPRRAYEVPAFAPGDVVHADGVGFNVLQALGRGEGFGRWGDAAFLAEATDLTAARVVLRVFAASPTSSPGPHVATAWRDGDDPHWPYGDYRSPMNWWPCAPAHEVFLTPRGWGWLRALAAPPEEPQLAPSAWRGAPYRAGTFLDAIDPPLPFVAFDRVEGATLRTLLRAAAGRALPLGPGFALAVGEPLAAALAWLHAHPVPSPDGPRAVWHGRLAGSGVFVTERGRCRLLVPVRCLAREFRGGLFSASDLQRLEEARDDAPYGAPAWAAGPEGDLWCLGALLWEAATGRALFAELMDHERFEARRTREPPLASSIEPQVTPALDACLVGLLSHDPARRFPSAAAAHEALAEARRTFDGPCDEAALAAVVAVLGAGEDGALALAGDGRDGTGEAVVLRVTETS